MALQKLSYQRQLQKPRRKRLDELRSGLWFAAATFLIIGLTYVAISWIITGGGHYRLDDPAYGMGLNVLGMSVAAAIGAWLLRENAGPPGYRENMPAESSNSLHALRIDYSVGQLNENEVAANPIEQFRSWFQHACEANVREPNAMTLATVDFTGMPSARIVLLKEFDERGFVFFTNYQSAKGHDLANNANAALLFFWETMERQVRIQGRASPVSTEDTAAYFAKRPREARIGAWASPQSQSIASRNVLNENVAALEAKFASGEVPPPPHWGGYRVVPSVVEFWQGRPSRLHDRLQYCLIDGTWKLQRLAP